MKKETKIIKDDYSGRVCQDIKIGMDKYPKISIVKPANVLISWGGGKDSTTVLLLASFYVVENIFNKLTIITFNNHLATESVRKNRRIIINFLQKKGVNFEWIVDDFGGENVTGELYRQGLLKTGMARAVCAVCNIQSEVLLNKILNQKKDIQYIMTGNTIDEMEVFRNWEKILGFKNATKNIKYDTLLGWSKIFDEWINYLSDEAGLNKADIDKFRIPRPKITDNAVIAEGLPLFKYHPEFFSSKNRINFIKKFGWKLPPAEEGVIGTETDCKFSSIIYGLNLIKNNDDYVEQLKKFENKDMMPKELLYRGTRDKDIILGHANDFLNKIGLDVDEWKRSSIKKLKLLSLKKYLCKCLLRVR